MMGKLKRESRSFNFVGRYIVVIVSMLLMSAAGCGESDVKRYQLNGETAGSDSELMTLEEFDALYDRYFKEDEDDWDPDGPPVVAPWTRVIDDQMIEDSLIEIGEDYVVFALAKHSEDLLAVELMDVIVSAHVEHPFLRRVIDIEKATDKITFQTYNEGIEAVVLAGSFSLDEAMGRDEDVREGNLKTIRQPQNTVEMDTNPPNNRNPTRTKDGFSIDFQVGLDYPYTPTLMGRPKFEFRMESSNARGMCRELATAIKGEFESSLWDVSTWFRPHEIPGSTLMSMMWAMKWAGHWRRPHVHRGHRPNCTAQPGLYVNAHETFMNWGWGIGDEKFDNCRNEDAAFWLAKANSETAIGAGSRAIGNSQRNVYVQYIDFTRAQISAHSRLSGQRNHGFELGYFLPTDQSDGFMVANPNIGNYIGTRGFHRANASERKREYLRELTALVEDRASVGSCQNAVTGEPLPCITEQTRQELLTLISNLRATPDFDSLHWLEAAPIVAKQYCEGRSNHARFGMGAKIQFDYEASLRFRRSASGPPGPLARMTGSDLSWKVPFGKKYMFFFIGWVPVLLSLEAGWETKIEAALNLDYTFTFPKRKADIDFYYGFLYDGSSVSWEKLEDIVPGERNRFDFNFPTLNEMNQSPGVLGASAEITANTGPKVEIKLYETIGISLGGQIYATAGLSSTETGCDASAKAGIKLTIGAEIGIPACPLDECKATTSTDIYDSCSHPTQKCQLIGDDRATWEQSGLCICAKIDICGAVNDTAAAVRDGLRGTPTPSPLVSSECINCATESVFVPDVNNPPGMNDVPGAFELDALWIERGSKRILPVELEGVSNCTAERGTVERGCPELLWYADFTTCEPDKWADKVALIEDMNAFRVRFREPIQEGDVVHVIRQGVRPGDMNAEGQVCRASGAMDLILGAVSQTEGEMWGSVSVAEGIYNSSSYRITEEHLNNTYFPPVDNAWPTRADADTFGVEEEGPASR